jgi:serine/threonine protein kinase
MFEKRIMHRDLKPANIFIANNGSLKVNKYNFYKIG